MAQAARREIPEYSKEDISAVKEQNMLAQALDMAEEETDEDEDLDEDTELKLKMKALGLNKKPTAGQVTTKTTSATEGADKDELDDQDW